MLDDWIRPPTGLMPASQLSLDFPWPCLQRKLHIEQMHQRARRIQELEHCFPLMRQPDWTVYHKVIKKLKGPARAAVDAWAQGSLRTHDSGERVPCPLCKVPVTMKHLVWQCKYHEQELPDEWQVSIITPVEGQRKWQRHRQGVVCEHCGKRIRACSTHSEISAKQATVCPVPFSKTLKQTMAELAQDTETLLDDRPGHKWELRATMFAAAGPRSLFAAARLS